MSPAELRLATQDGRILVSDEADYPLWVNGLTVAYHRKPVLWNIDFSVPAGSLCAIVGPNGAGKSTFIKAVLGLVPVIAGDIRLFGRPLRSVRHKVAYVPQRNSVDWDFPAHALDVVLMGLYRQIGVFRWIGRRHRVKAMACLEKVGMAEFAKRQIGQLSGGQQQRVFLARALAEDADLYILDEPFAGVDAATERSIIGVLRGLVAAGKTVLCVHHDLETVPDYFDRVFLLNGRTVAHGAVSDVFTEENLQAAYGGRLAATQVAALR